MLQGPTVTVKQELFPSQGLYLFIQKTNSIFTWTQSEREKRKQRENRGLRDNTKDKSRAKREENTKKKTDVLHV